MRGTDWQSVLPADCQSSGKETAMRTRTLLAAALVGAALTVALGQENGTVTAHEAVVKEMLKTLEEINGVLGKIGDGPGAEAARPELKESDKKLRELRKKAAEM